MIPLFSKNDINPSHPIEKGYGKGANFKGVDLTAAAFINADLTEANFENTICAGGFFRGANLKNASFKRADLHYAEFEGPF